MISSIIVDNLANKESIMFIDTSKLRFIYDWTLIRQGFYEPKIKTMIRIMDTPSEDIIHHYIEQGFPAIKIME